MSADPGDEADPLWTPTHQSDGVSGARESTKSGVLVLAGTPIGDPSDASPRLREALGTADIVAAEDTRRLRRLVRDLGVQLAGRVVSYYDANESSRTPELLDALREGRRVVVVTDAGMPSVSDPGYRLVAAAHDAGLRVTAVPGPSAVLTALAISGLPVDRFCFEGFLPRKAGERAARLLALADEPRTLVFFEAPHRLAVMLAAMAAAFGAERRAAVCREMTKTYEEVRRGGLAELTTWATDGVRGEITIVVAGAEPRAPADTADLVAAVLARVEAGERLKEATGEVAQQHGLVRRDLYQAVLDARATQPPRRQPAAPQPPSEW